MDDECFKEKEMEETTFAPQLFVPVAKPLMRNLNWAHLGLVGICSAVNITRVRHLVRWYADDCERTSRMMTFGHHLRL